MEKTFDTIAETVRTINVEELEIYRAGYEEYLADFDSDPRFFGEGLSSRIAHNKEVAMPAFDLEVSRNLTDADLKQGLSRILTGKPFMAIAGNMEQIPRLEKYVNTLRRDLAIDGNEQGSNIKEEFNPKDP